MFQEHIENGVLTLCKLSQCFVYIKNCLFRQFKASENTFKVKVKLQRYQIRMKNSLVRYINYKEKIHAYECSWLQPDL